MNILKKALLTVLALGGASASVSAYADCTFVAGYSADTQELINFGTVTAPLSTPVGTVVATKTSTVLMNRNLFITGCTTFNQQDWRSPGLTPVSYGGQVLYQSGVAGYAIRIVTPGAGSTTGQFGSGAFDRIITSNFCTTSGTPWGYCGGSWGTVTFELVKISPSVGAGQMSAGTLVRASIRGWNWIYTANLTSSSIVSPGCTVTNTSIPIAMDKVSTKDFTGVGATASPKTVTIPLNCNAGTKVSVTLDGTRHSSGIAGVLALDSSGSTSVATGLGLQLLYNNTAVTLGSATSVGATTSNGTYNVGLTARYYQTAATVTAGQANSTATFTMTYN